MESNSVESAPPQRPIMHFPLYLNLLGLRVHPHLLMELLAYTGGFQLYLALRRRGVRSGQIPPQPLERTLWLLVGAVLGAVVGSKTLAWAESPWDYLPYWNHPVAWLGGKTIVGGLLGGWAGVELAKHRLGIARRTGDLYVFPLILGMAVGRVGCFLTGLADHTHGTPSAVPWAIDYGDGIPRHPTQLYEIAFLLLLGVALFTRSRRPHPEGHLLRLFLLCYFLMRFAIEFIKPTYKPYLGLSAIQLASLAGAGVCAWQLARERLELAGAVATG